MAHVDWETAWLEPGNGHPQAVLIVNIADAETGWEHEFSRRLEIRLHSDTDRIPWGPMLYANGTLIVGELQPDALDDLERFLHCIWP